MTVHHTLFENLLKICAWAIIIATVHNYKLMQQLNAHFIRIKKTYCHVCCCWRLKGNFEVLFSIDQPVHKLCRSNEQPVVYQLRGWVLILVDNGSSAYSSI